MLDNWETRSSGTLRPETCEPPRMHERNAGSNAQAASLLASDTKPRIRLITPVWGRFYINRWLDLSFAALRSEGNIPFLNKNSDFELAVITKSEDAAFMQADPKFNSVTAGVRVKFITMDEFFPPNGEVTYGVPLTLAYGKAIQDLGENGIGTYVILMNADFVLASGSLRSLLARIRNGFTSIAAASIRVINAGARVAELSRRPSRDSVDLPACHDAARKCQPPQHDHRPHHK